MMKNTKKQIRIPNIESYISALDEKFSEICRALTVEIKNTIPSATSKLFHGSPVWFIDDNPIVGFNATAKHVSLLFWSGQSFDEQRLKPTGKYKAAQMIYTSVDDIDTADLFRC